MGHNVKLEETIAGDPGECLLQADLGWLLKQAYYSLASEIHAALGPLGVTPRGYHVLEAALLGEHTQSEVAETVQLDKTTMVVTMDELEASGLAERRPSDHDRRARVIRVTPAGEALVLRAREAQSAIQADVLASLPGERGAELLEGLRTLIVERLAEPVACTPALRKRQPRR